MRLRADLAGLLRLDLLRNQSLFENIHHLAPQVDHHQRHSQPVHTRRINPVRGSRPKWQTGSFAYPYKQQINTGKIDQGVCPIANTRSGRFKGAHIAMVPATRALAGVLPRKIQEWSSPNSGRTPGGEVTRTESKRGLRGQTPFSPWRLCATSSLTVPCTKHTHAAAERGGDRQCDVLFYVRNALLLRTSDLLGAALPRAPALTRLK